MAEKSTAKRKFGTSYRAWPGGFEFLHVPDLPITDDQVEEIATSLGVGNESDHVAAVLAAIRRFHGRETAMAKLPQGDHREHDVKTLTALAQAMDGMNANVVAALAHYSIDLGNYESTRVAQVARLAAAQIEKARVTASRRGRRPLSSRAATLRDLAKIYEQATSKAANISVTSGSGITKAGQPKGRFFRFLRAAIEPVPKLSQLDDHALAKAVKRAKRTK